MEKINYQKVMEETLSTFDLKSGERKKLLLHSCCAPCSSYVLTALTEYFDIYVFYYNPNIYPFEEYEKRLGELKRLIQEMPLKGKVELVDTEYDEESYINAVKGLESAPEGGKRCSECFCLRLNKTAEKAKELNVDYFTTTLTVSPHKGSQAINAIGKQISDKIGVSYLLSDFKKKDGYKQSIILSEQYGLYRQNYCGCKFAFTSAQSQ